MKPHKPHSLTLLKLLLAMWIATLVYACSGDTSSPPTDPQTGPLRSDLLAPAVQRTVPNYGYQGTTLTVRVLGSEFDSGSRVDFELDGEVTDKVRAKSTRFVSTSELESRVEIAPDAPVRAYQVRVTKSTGKKGHGLEDFTVRPGEPGGEGPSPDPQTALNVTGRIAFTHASVQGPGLTVVGDIHVMSADGTGRVNLTDHPAHDHSPSWSPDGSRIAFTSHREGNTDIYAINSDGTGLVRLTDDPRWDGIPAWSPDGSKIAFVRAEDSRARGEVYVMNVDGSEPVNLTRDPLHWDSYPFWSPDGSRIAFARAHPRRGVSDIYVMNADGTGLVNLTSDGMDRQEEQPSWSPDGSRIAFAAMRDGMCFDCREIWIINSDGTGETRLTSTYDWGVLTPSWDPAWSPDGKSIVFVRGWMTSQGMEQGIYMMDVGTGTEVSLTASPGSEVMGLGGRYDTNPAWAP